MKPQRHELSRVFTYHVKHLPESGGLIEIAGSQAVKTVAEVRGPIAPEKQLRGTLNLSVSLFCSFLLLLISVRTICAQIHAQVAHKFAHTRLRELYHE